MPENGFLHYPFVEYVFQLFFQVRSYILRRVDQLLHDICTIIEYVYYVFKVMTCPWVTRASIVKSGEFGS